MNGKFILLRHPSISTDGSNFWFIVCYVSQQYSILLKDADAGRFIVDGMASIQIDTPALMSVSNAML